MVIAIRMLFEGRELECALLGFGMVACAACEELFRPGGLIEVGTRCQHCGVAVSSVEQYVPAAVPEKVSS